MADIDKEDFYWTVLFIDQFLKDDIGYHWATYNDILTGRKSGTGVCALKYTLRIDKLCVCVCVQNVHFVFYTRGSCQKSFIEQEARIFWELTVVYTLYLNSHYFTEGD